MSETNTAKFVFLHLLKTGGKTVEKHLQRKFGGAFVRTTKLFSDESLNNIYSILVSNDDSKLQELQTAKVISGHFPYGVHKLVEGDCRYFTLIRNPVGRIRSYYAYSLANEGSRIQAYLRNNQISFEQFVQLEKRDIQAAGVHELNYVLEDGQCKLIAGEDIRVGEGSTGHLYTAADANISKHFDFVGITELFEDSMMGISEVLNLSKFSPYITQNRSLISVDVPQNASKIIAERNENDIAMHKKYFGQVAARSHRIQHRLVRTYMRLGNWLADAYVGVRR